MNTPLLSALLLLMVLLATTTAASTTAANATVTTTDPPRRHDCYTVPDLRTALRNAQPGDDIVLYPGSSTVFQGHFYATNDGTSDNPITIRSAFARATLRGFSIHSPGAVLYVTGNHWTVKDLIIENGNKGVIFDNVKGGMILNCKVHTTGTWWWVHVYPFCCVMLIE